MRVLYFSLSLLGVVLFVLTTFLLSMVGLIVGPMGWRAAQSFVIRSFGVTGLLYFRVKVRCHGDLSAPNEGAIYIFNHQSHIDILAMCAHLPATFRYGAKIELFKIPIFGHSMRFFGVLPIPRSNRAEAFKVYERATERLQKGALFALAPEGTRQAEPMIGKFKKGPFIFAIKCQAPLIPVILKRMNEALPKNEIIPNTRNFIKMVDLKVLPPLSTQGRSLETLDSLVENTREIFVKEFESL